MNKAVIRNKGITGKTNHDYYCESEETMYKTFNFDSFTDFVCAGKSRFIKDKINEFYTRRIDLSNLTLFRFDIKDNKQIGMYLELHYCNPDEYEGLYHDIIKITEEDFPIIEEFLRKEYKKLEDSFKDGTIIDEQPLYTDTTCSFERIVEGANHSYRFHYNFPYHYQWYKDKNGKLCIVICFAGQRHGYSQWIPRIVDLSVEQAKIMQNFLRTTVFSYVKKQWLEVAED